MQERGGGGEGEGWACHVTGGDRDRRKADTSVPVRRGERKGDRKMAAEASVRVCRGEQLPPMRPCQAQRV